MRLQFGMIALLSGIGSVAFSQTATLDCVPLVAGTATRCKLHEAVEVMSSPGFTADVKIKYRFKCRGHSLGLSLVSDTGSKSIPFTDQESEIEISASNQVRIEDLDSSKTYRATVKGDCRVEVTAVSFQPSFIQLGSWRNDASNHVTILDDAVDLVALAMSTETVEDLTARRSKTLITDLWLYLDTALLSAGVEQGVKHFTDASRTRLLTLEQMRAIGDGRDIEWEILTSDHDEILNYHTTLSAVQALKDELPQPRPQSEVTAAVAAAVGTLASSYRTKLVARITAAQEFLTMTQHWQHVATEALKQAQAELETALRSARNQ